MCGEATGQRLLWKWVPSANPGTEKVKQDPRPRPVLVLVQTESGTHLSMQRTWMRFPVCMPGGFLSSSLLLSVPAWGGTELQANRAVIRSITGGAPEPRSHHLVVPMPSAWEPYELGKLYIESAGRNGTVVSFAYITSSQSASPRVVGGGDVARNAKTGGFMHQYVEQLPTSTLVVS